MKKFNSQMEKEIYDQPQVLAGILSRNKTAIDLLVRELENKPPKFVSFAARGTSNHASMYAQYLLGIVKGIPAALVSPSIITVYDAKVDLSDTLVIGVSQSGKAKDVCEVLAHANRCGAVTVAVTNNESSPMAAEAKHSLFCAAGEEISVAATKTFTAQMYVLAAFIAKWARDEKLLARLESVPGTMTGTLDTLSPLIRETTAHYRDMTDGFVLGRGTNYPIALESALKLQETNYVRMKGYAISDFYHGPLAQVETGTPVILLAGGGPCLENARDMLVKLQEIGADVILVSDQAELVRDRARSFLLPDLGSDLVSPFLFAVFVQLFACCLTEVKGLSPDRPRNLKKVTITL